jgi:hypothetical protein
VAVLQEQLAAVTAQAAATAAQLTALQAQHAQLAAQLEREAAAARTAAAAAATNATHAQVGGDCQGSAASGAPAGVGLGASVLPGDLPPGVRLRVAKLVARAEDLERRLGEAEGLAADLGRQVHWRE